MVRCQGHRGHNSAHYGGGHWWPNEKGLPFHMRVSARWVILGWLAAATGFGWFIYWLVSR
jgi:hypothetical protein